MDPLIAEWKRDFRVYAVHNGKDKNNIYEVVFKINILDTFVNRCTAKQTFIR